MLHVHGPSRYLWSRTGFHLKENLLMSSYMCLKIGSHRTKCGASHTTSCTSRSEVDAP